MEERKTPGADQHEDDALRRLEARLDRASGVAERLIAEAARASMSSAGRVAEAATRAGRAAGPPPAGWEAPREDADSRRDVEVLAQVIQSLRELIPPDLQRRVTEALRELLLALRALIDWYLERAEKHRGAPAEVHDIPIE